MNERSRKQLHDQDGGRRKHRQCFADPIAHTMAPVVDYQGGKNHHEKPHEKCVGAFAFRMILKKLLPPIRTEVPVEQLFQRDLFQNRLTVEHLDYITTRSATIRAKTIGSCCLRRRRQEGTWEQCGVENHLAACCSTMRGKRHKVDGTADDGLAAHVSHTLRMPRNSPGKRPPGPDCHQGVPG